MPEWCHGGNNAVLQYGRGVRCPLCHGEHWGADGARACWDAFRATLPQGKPPKNEDR